MERIGRVGWWVKRVGRLVGWLGRRGDVLIECVGG